jgi:hypothetical protein
MKRAEIATQKEPRTKQAELPIALTSMAARI